MQTNQQISPEQGGRVPPQAVEVEESVLGAMLIEKESVDIALENLVANDFYKPSNKHIYEVIVDLHRDGVNPNIISIENELRDRNLLDVIGGQGYLADLTRSVASAAHMENHCDIIKAKSIKRQMILKCNNLIKLCYDTTTDPSEAIEMATTMLDDLSGDMFRNEAAFVKDLLEGVMDDILERKNSKGLTGIATGLSIDKYTGGWQPGDLYIIAGRPSLGKTALALQCAFNSALFESVKAPGYYGNIEMKNYDLIKRRLAVESGINFKSIRDGKISDADFKDILQAAGKLYQGKLMLDDTPAPNIYQFAAKYKTAVRRWGIKFGMIDYLQLMSGDGKANTREQEISSISRGLKSLAKETNTPIIALAQLSRACEKNTGARPYLSDLRESGAIEQDADGVFLINRPEFFGHGTYIHDNDHPTKGKGWIHIAKMRNSSTGTIRMNFDKNYAVWRDEPGVYEKFEAEISLRDEANQQGEDFPMPHSLPDDMEEGTPF